ncbi:hypothetical protein [uncultured Dokdonia sp.]|uniref:hypothetical protein n=1 Tax=uncultured Dokdonia sp. TaxID=575653 RepID=UPI00262FB314|nr:hypothetical protein [uncultured Dokdonia sp.]
MSLNNDYIRKYRSSKPWYEIIAFALEDFRGDYKELLHNALLYKKIIYENPMENNQKGMISDEEYYKYWGLINEIEGYGFNHFWIDLYKDKAIISDQFDPNYNNGLEIPIDDWIDILKECMK